MSRSQHPSMISATGEAGSSSSAQYPQIVSFKPANASSHASLTDLVDLNDLFADEFYNNDLEYPKLFSFDEFGNATSTGLDVDQFQLTPSYDQISLSSISPNYSFGSSFPSSSMIANSQELNSKLNDKMLRGKNDVIMIPPTMPRITQSVVPMVKMEGANKSKGKPIDEKSSTLKRSFEAVEASKSGAKNQGSNAAIAASSSAGGDEKESIEMQKIERRERNREHAKKSRIRKKLLLDTLQDQLALLRNENMKLRGIVTEKIPHLAAKILLDCTTSESSLLSQLNSDNEDSTTEGLKPSPLTSNIAQNVINNVHLSNQSSSSKKPIKQSAKILMEPDYRLIQSLVTSQQNFVLSDPSLPDNPIVYASDGFCKMTGYKRHEVLGRNCRFLQGPLTDQAAVDIIRQGIIEGRDISVCLLNYKADGTPFWNQFFLAALKDADGQIVNYVGVQCEVNNIPVSEIKDRVKKLPIPSEI